MKTLTKSELAKILNISPSSFQNLMNRVWYEDLKKLKYKKNSKLLNHKIVKFVFDEWGISE